MDPSTITFASLLTIQGTVVAAGIVTSLVELLKRVRDPAPLPGTGAAWAFGLSALLYVLAGVATGVATLDQGLVVFMAWLGCSLAAVGIHSTARTMTR